MSEKVNLNEYLHPEMDLLFVALNAPVNSNNNKHWFTNNLSFWNLLHRVGIITMPVTNKLEGDVMVFGGTSVNHNNWQIGVTDLIRNIVETNSNKVEPNPGDVKRILEILENNKVERLCLMHSKVGEAFREYSSISFNQNRYGKIGTYKSTEIFEVPFHNASILNKDSYYALLVEDSKHISINKKNIPLRSKPKKLETSAIKNELSFKNPKPGNSITEKDIDKGQLRITVDFKEYFPKQSRSVNIKYLGRNYSAGYTYRASKSSMLKVGKGFMEMMRITARSRIRFTIRDDKYIIEII